MYIASAPPDNRTERRSVALAVTLLLHGGLLLFLLFWKIITPIPPFPDTGGGSGLELALGFTELGMGDNARSQDPSPPASQAQPEPQPQEEETTLTGADEESVPVKEQPKPDKPKTDKPKPKEPVKPKEPTVSKGLQNALNAWNTTGSGSEGKGASTTPGVAGGPTGSATGNGIGNGTGSYRGDGWSVDLAGRNIRRKPVINEKPTVGGKVVLDIWVGVDGKVLRVAQNTSKSTTLDQTLVTIAKRAALESSFYPDPKATSEQKGTMIFIFTLE